VSGGCRRRRQRGDAPKPAPFATRNNSYRNVILAFGGGAGGDDSATPPPPPLPAPSTYSSSCSGGGGGGSPGEVVELGCSNPVTSAPLAAAGAGECRWEARAWPPPPRPRGAAKLPAVVGGALMPIDERLEDLYTAAKQQHQHQQRWRETQQVMRVGLLEVASVRNSQHTHTHTHPFNGPFPGLPG